ncbi:hypothetical protein H4R99_005988 [Coemansia sp. RSA 1722]|nr:hypothetical protein LPJ57_006898 [Coemansia sp. RSA 486]KAJ2237307.1 hypothetical protein IWW45_001061 [Coemansia sp. RSA 485]KAJ2593803.1 hypothetical protein H4R99_005988 [Coemansia sp. RSA 1722]
MALNGLGQPNDIINLRDTSNPSTEETTSSPSYLHLLPCAIKYDGPAKTETYFIPTEQTNGTYEASFRGRQLFGRKIAIPIMYSGHVVIETAVSTNTHDSAFETEITDESEQRELLTVENFNGFVVWEHDRVPAVDDDEFITSLEWIDVAASIHADCSSATDSKN